MSYDIICLMFHFPVEIPAYTHTGVRWKGEDTYKRLTLEDLPAFDSLDGHTQAQLLLLIEQGAYQRMASDCREVNPFYQVCFQVNQKIPVHQMEFLIELNS